MLDAFCASKHIDIPALMRLGTRVQGNTLAFAYPSGIKFRDMETGKRWSYFGSDFHELKIVRSGKDRSGTVIVVEGETDAARLSMVYDCDIAALPAGAKRFTQAFADQLMAYPQVLVGLDDDAAGNTGAQKIAGYVPHAVRFLPPANDWCAVQEGFPPLPEIVAPADTCGPIVFTDLVAVIEGGLPEPEVLVDDQVYTEGVHWLSGHPGSGKTTFAMDWAVQVMNEGRHVVWFDWEGGVAPSARRLVAVGVKLDTIGEFFHYAGWPANPQAYLGDIAARWPGALVVFDSASKSLNSAGKSENSPEEVTEWTVPIVKGAKTHRLPIVVIDHVAKEDKGQYARGAGAKLADTDVHWKIEVVQAFDRETQGTVALRRMKDREGCLPPVLYFNVGDGNGRLTIMPTDGPPEDEGEPKL